MKLPATVTTWTELRLFIAELAQNQKNHWCFPAKSTAISKSNGVERQIFRSICASNKSRISVLITKVRMLDLYILDKIPDDKVVVSIAEINKNWLPYRGNG
jgi:hypothetical protein